MFRRIALLLGVTLVASSVAYAEVHMREYGAATTVDFKLYNTDGTLDVDEVDGGTEVTLYCDEAAGATATNDFVDEGPFYSIALTAVEMQCARLAVEIAATDTNVVFVETYGNASAQNEAFASNVTEIEGADPTDTINAQADAAIETYHLDHLLAVDYDPSSQPGVGTALFNEIIENDAGVSRFTTNALENAPGSGSINDSDLGIIAQGTAQAATSTTLQLASAETFADDEIIGSTCVIDGGSAGVGQSRAVTDYTSSTDTATVDTWTTTPTGTITYTCFGTAPGSEDGSSFTSIPWNSSWDTEVQSEASDALTAYDPPTNAELTTAVADVSVDEVQATALADFFNTDSGTTYASAVAGSVVSEIADNAGTSTNITQIEGVDATDQIDARIAAYDSVVPADLPTNFADLSITATTGRVDVAAIGGTTQTANDVGGDVDAILVDTAEIGAAGAGLTAADDAVMTRLGAPAGASISADIAAVPTSAEIEAEFVVAEPSGVPTWSTATMTEMVAYMGAWFRNEVNQTATTKSLRNDADSANLVTCGVSDDGTTFSVAECAAP